MESKILVFLEVPALPCRLEVLVPSGLKVKEALPLLIKAVYDLSGGAYASSEHEFLCAKRQNFLLDEDATLEACGIRNGDHLLML